MSDSPNTVLEVTKLITSFLTENSYIFLAITLIAVCRKSISNFISRLISLTFKKGELELGLNANAPTNKNKEKEDVTPNANDKPVLHEHEDKIEKEVHKNDWLSKMSQAFEDGKIEEAEIAFKTYSIEEKDEVKVEENKAFYLYLRFEKGKDNSAVKDLEELARVAKTEDSKFNSLLWFSFCLDDGMQYTKEIALWKKAIQEIQSKELRTKSIIQLALALKKVDKLDEAKELLIKELASVKDEMSKSSIFNALSKIEAALGSKVISIYCKDKAVEFDPNNREELFNSAYSASEEGIEEVSISNYLQLIRIDADNATALNNLAVQAREAGVKIKAVENYKESSALNNTLAMANQGYLLLEAGFIEEAENLAQKALDLDDTHPNIYNLITNINKEKAEQKTKWEDLCKNSLKRQRMIRCYTENYYLGDSNNLEGKWFTSESIEISLSVKGSQLETSWEETSSETTYKVNLVGQVSGATFTGKFSKKKISGESKNLFLSLDSDHECMGYISEDNDKIIVFNSKLKGNFSLVLTREKA